MSGSSGQRPAGGGDAASGATTEPHPSIQAYNTINKFLAAFIEHVRAMHRVGRVGAPLWDAPAELAHTVCLLLFFYT